MLASRLDVLKHRFAGCRMLALSGVVALLASPAAADIVTRESDITGLRLGQHVLVDDASCPAGQIKEIVGLRLTPAGVERGRKCIERKGARR